MGVTDCQRMMLNRWDRLMQVWESLDPYMLALSSMEQRGQERVLLSLYWRKQLYRFSVESVLCTRKIGKPQSTYMVLLPDRFHVLLVEQLESLLGQVESSEYPDLG